MTRRLWIPTICFMLWLAIGSGAIGRMVWAYYDCTPGVHTVVMLSNASEFVDDEAVTLTVYDADGRLLHESVHGLSEYESTALFLNDLLEQTDGSTWGLISIESRLLVQTGVWVGTERGWLFVENYGELTADHVDAFETYWYGASYANTSNRRTTITILNPNERLVFGTMYIYDAYGAMQKQHVLTLPARQPTYLDLETIIPTGESAWGWADIESAEPVLVVCTYYDGEGYLIDVDVVEGPYFLERDAEE